MLDKTTADKLAPIAVKQIAAGMKYKKKRMDKIREYENSYLNEVPLALPGKFSVVVPVMGGFIDTLLSKINDNIRINFDKQEEADLLKSKKVTSMWERDSAPTRGKWKIKDIRGKKLAAFSGVAIYYNASEGDENTSYKNIHRNVDHNNFYCEPKKGPDLEEHRYLGEMNIWRSKAELKQGVVSGYYDKDQVDKLINDTTDGEKTKNDLLFAADKQRYAALGLDDSENYTGDTLYCLTNHYMEYEGKRYYVLLDYSTGSWIRAEELTEMFSTPEGEKKSLWPYVAWHTHDNALEFWSKSPADDVWPVHEEIRIVLSLAFESLKKRTRTKRAVDPEVFPDISELEDDITQNVETNTLAAGKSISNAVYEFRTEDNTSIVINLTNFLNSLVGEKSGITPGAQGNADEQRATIYVGNTQQVANRMSLYSDFYKQCWAELGLRYFIGLKDHLTEGQFVKILGLQGYEWSEMTKDDVHPIRDFDIKITGGDEESELSQLKTKVKTESLTIAVREYKAFLNPLWASEQLLRAGGWEDEDIKQAQDLDVHGNRMVLSEAAQAIQDILAGKEPKLNRKANEAFIMKVTDYADDHEDTLTDDEYENLYAYAYMHVRTVVRNTIRRQTLLMSMRNSSPMFQMGPGQGQPQGMGQGQPIQGSPIKQMGAEVPQPMRQ